MYTFFNRVTDIISKNKFFRWSLIKAFLYTEMPWFCPIFFYQNSFSRFRDISKKNTFLMHDYNTWPYPVWQVTIYRSLVHSVFTHGMWVQKIKISCFRPYLCRSCRFRRVDDRARNEIIRNMVEMERDIVDEVQRKQLIWYGDMCRMDEGKSPNRVLQWKLSEKPRRGRPVRCWMDEVNKAMRSRNLSEQDSQNRERRRLGAEKRRERSKSAMMMMYIIIELIGL